MGKRTVVFFVALIALTAKPSVTTTLARRKAACAIARAAKARYRNERLAYQQRVASLHLSMEERLIDACALNRLSEVKCLLFEERVDPNGSWQPLAWPNEERGGVAAAMLRYRCDIIRLLLESLKKTHAEQLIDLDAITDLLPEELWRETAEYTAEDSLFNVSLTGSFSTVRLTFLKLTPLLCAVIAGHTDVVRLLLRAGANPWLPGLPDGLHVARLLLRGRPEIVRLLLDAQPSFPEPNNFVVHGSWLLLCPTAFLYAACLDSCISLDDETFTLLREHGASFEQCKHVICLCPHKDGGVAFVYQALKTGNTALVDQMLRSGAQFRFNEKTAPLALVLPWKELNPQHAKTINWLLVHAHEYAIELNANMLAFGIEKSPSFYIARFKEAFPGLR